MIMVKIKFRLTYNIYTVHQTRIMHYSDFFLFLPSLQGSFELPGKGFQNSPNWQVPAGDYYIITIFYFQMLGNGLTVLTNASDIGDIFLFMHMLKSRKK